MRAPELVAAERAARRRAEARRRILLAIAPITAVVGFVVGLPNRTMHVPAASRLKGPGT